MKATTWHLAVCFNLLHHKETTFAIWWFLLQFNLLYYQFIQACFLHVVISLPDSVAYKSRRPSLFLVVVIVLSLTGSYLKLSKSNTSSCSRKHTQIANSIEPALTHSHAYNKSLTVLPSSSLLVVWDHYYWLADGPGGQWCRLYLWLCVGAGVCIPCHVLCPGMLPGPVWVSDEHTVAGPAMTEWDPGSQASPKVWRLHRRRSRGTDGFRGMERPQPGCGVYLHFRRGKWTHGYMKRLCLRLITEWVEAGRVLEILKTYKHLGKENCNENTDPFIKLILSYLNKTCMSQRTSII